MTKYKGSPVVWKLRSFRRRAGMSQGSGLEGLVPGKDFDRAGPVVGEGDQYGLILRSRISMSTPQTGPASHLCRILDAGLVVLAGGRECLHPVTGTFPRQL